MFHKECRDLHVRVLIDDAGHDLVGVDLVAVDLIPTPKSFLVLPTDPDVFRVCLKDVAMS